MLWEFGSDVGGMGIEVVVPREENAPVWFELFSSVVGSILDGRWKRKEDWNDRGGALIGGERGGG